MWKSSLNDILKNGFKLGSKNQIDLRRLAFDRVYLRNQGKIVLDFLSQMCAMLENKNPTEKGNECIPWLTLFYTRALVKVDLCGMVLLNHAGLPFAF